MVVIEIPSSRKRRQSQVESSEASLPSTSAQNPLLLARRQKLKNNREYSSQDQSPGAFWNSLSKIWLTKDALKELGRKNAQSVNRLPCAQITRSTVAGQKRIASFLPDTLSIQRSEIRQFARHGGPDLCDLRGYREPIDTLDFTMSKPSPKTPTTSTGSDSKSTSGSRKSWLYNPKFEQHFIDHGIYPKGYQYPDGRTLALPNNWKEINERLKQRRPSLSLSKFNDDDFGRFTRAEDCVFREEDVVASVIRFIAGETKGYRTVAGDVNFENLDPLTDCQIVPGRPDLFYGARPEQLNLRVRRELAGQIVPSTQEDVPMVPNFFLEVDGPDGSAAVAKRQALQNGAIGARAIHTLQSFGADEPVYDGNAYTITSTYHDGQLKIYTMHPIKSQDPHRLLDYHMKQLRAFALTDNLDGFRQGVAAYRNARDWAMEQRDKFINEANRQATNTAAVTAAVSLESDASADEVALDEDIGRASARKRAPTTTAETSSRPTRRKLDERQMKD